MTNLDLHSVLIFGSYVFTVGSYLFVWQLFQTLGQVRELLSALVVKVENHHEHQLDEIRARLDRLER